MSSVRIKICGITRAEDAAAAEALGVDALGFVFVERSKRFIDIERAARLCAGLGPFVTPVGLFLNAETGLVDSACNTIPGLVLQFHGQESAEFCDQFQRPYIKSVGLGGTTDLAATTEALSTYRNATAFLYDSNAPGQLGGTGHTFDWQMLTGSSVRTVLAGGLTPDNVADGIRQVSPYAVDVSTGVESAPGIKDAALMSRFVTAVRGS